MDEHNAHLLLSTACHLTRVAVPRKALAICRPCDVIWQASKLANSHCAAHLPYCGWIQ